MPSPAHDASDLEILIPSKAPRSNVSSGLDVSGSHHIRNLDLDQSVESSRSVPMSQRVSVARILYAHCMILFNHRPWIFLCLSLLIFVLFLSIIAALMNPTIEIGDMPNDYTNIQSSYDLSMGRIDHWCLGVGNDGCLCEDPLNPISRSDSETWVKAYNENKKVVESYRGSDIVDVAFLGSSFVEEMEGRWMGSMENDHLKILARNFRKHFKKENGGLIEGVTLGIAGDTAPNVLWRILNGEMPDDFNPKVWWISLGMNDLTRMKCSEEIVVLGILRVVEEIHGRQPNAKIVINSLLPMTKMREGAAPALNDFQDAFQKYQKMKAQFQSSGGNRFLIGDKESGQMKNELSQPKVSERGYGKVSDEKIDEAAKVAEAMSVEWQDKQKKILDFLLNHKEALDKFNPQLRDKDTMKEFDPKKLFLKKNEAALWPSILTINQELHNFCKKHDHITFFDSTPIFSDRKDGDNYQLRSDLISNRGHPTENGYKKWEHKATSQLQFMLDVNPGINSHAVDIVPAWKSVYGSTEKKNEEQQQAHVEEEEDFEEERGDTPEEGEEKYEEEETGLHEVKKGDEEEEQSEKEGVENPEEEETNIEEEDEGGYEATKVEEEEGPDDEYTGKGAESETERDQEYDETESDYEEDEGFFIEKKRDPEESPEGDDYAF